MNAIPAPGARGASGSESRATWRRAALLAPALLVTGLQAVAQEPVPAVWQSRKLSFSYSSSTNIFSCGALAGRVASILRAVGARDDVQVKASGCSNAIPPQSSQAGDRVTMTAWDPMSDRASVRGPDARQYVHLNVRLMLPTEVTPEVLDELKKDKSRRELVARVTGNPAARFNDPVMFHAQWQPVTLSRKTIGIEPQECELLEQMSPGVFRQLGMRVVGNAINCSADSLIPPQMVVEALMAAPLPSISLPEPPTGEKDAEDDAADGAGPSDDQ